MVRNDVIAISPNKGGASSKRRSDNITGWLFVTPILIGIALFVAFPLGYAVYLSFTDMQLINETVNFIGFDNYINIFTNDEYFLRSLLNALINAIGVPIGIALALVLSNIIVSNPKFSIIFKSIYYVPTICGAIAITFVWKIIYANGYGLLFTVLENMGMTDFKLLDSSNFWPLMIIMGIWSGLGNSTLLLFASLKGISKSLYEAADIDGANFFQKFRYVTIPATSSVTFYILVTGIAGSFQDYTRFTAMKGSYETWNVMPVWYIVDFTSAARGFNYGYGSALGILLGLVIVIISAIQFIASKYWVRYD